MFWCWNNRTHAMLKKSSPHLRRVSFVPGCGDKPGCRKKCNQWRSRSDWCIGCTVAVFFCKFNVVVLRPNKTQQNLQGLSERTCHKMKQTTSRIWLVLEETPWIRWFFQDSAAADLMSRIGVFMSAKVWKHRKKQEWISFASFQFSHLLHRTILYPKGRWIKMFFSCTPNWWMQK